MTNLTERVARLHCALDGVDPDSSLGGDGQNFLWMEYAETHAKPTLTEIFNYLENPSEEEVEAGARAGVDQIYYKQNAWDRCVDDEFKPDHLNYAKYAWKAMLAQFKEEALGK